MHQWTSALTKTGPLSLGGTFMINKGGSFLESAQASGHEGSNHHRAREMVSTAEVRGSIPSGGGKRFALYCKNLV
jgi:hypothetical protein